MTANIVRGLAAAVAIVLLGGAGFCGASIGQHLYEDHLLIDAARAADQQRVVQAAEQVKQFQDQQKQQAPAAPAPAK